MTLIYFNSVVRLLRLCLVLIYSSLSLVCIGQQGLSLNERLTKHALINQIKVPNASSEVTVVDQLNYQYQLRSGNYTHRVDSAIVKAGLIATRKVEFLYVDNDVYALYSVADD